MKDLGVKVVKCSYLMHACMLIRKHGVRSAWMYHFFIGRYNRVQNKSC